MEAAAALIKRVKTHSNPLALEKESVYGVGILVPQLARSSGWPKALIVMTAKMYMFVALNFFMQVTILAAIQKEQNVMDFFSGQMYLCDFGAPIAPCPDSPSCQGPGGTKISAPRLYNFQSWVTRTFVRDSLVALWPDRAKEIHEKIDPGEYGAESRIIRWLCCGIFMTEVMNELTLIYNLVLLLWTIPTRADSWIYMDNDEFEVDGNEENEIDEDNLRLRVAGMPACWKLINVMTILLPKILLWYLTAEAGVAFLMETAAMSDMIINAVGLVFILQIDESICANLMSPATNKLMSECRDYEPEETDKLVKEGTEGSELSPEDSALSREDSKASIPAVEAVHQHYHQLEFMELVALLPWRLMMTITMTAVFVCEYYMRHCTWEKDGGWFASRPARLPKSTSFSIANVFFPMWFPVPREEEPFWRYTPPE